MLRLFRILFRVAGNACPFARKTNVSNVYTAFWILPQTFPCRALTSAASQQPSPTQVSPSVQPLPSPRLPSQSLPSQSLPSQPAPSQPPPSQAPLVQHVPQRSGQIWSAEESDTLSTLYKSGKTHHEIAAKLKRSWTSVRTHAHKLRKRGDIAYRSSGPGRPFTPEEDARLLSARQQKLQWTRISELFPHRSTMSLSQRLRVLSGRMPEQPPKTSRRIRFSNDDDARILHLRCHEGLSIPQVALLVSRTKFSVTERWASLRKVPNPPFSTTVAREYQELKRSGNLPRNFYGFEGERRRWTPQDFSQVRAMSASGASREEIAAALGRTTCAIEWGIQRFASWEKDGKHAPRAWTQEEASRLSTMTAEGADDAEIARALSRSKQAVYGKRKRLVAGKIKSKSATGAS